METRGKYTALPPQGARFVCGQSKREVINKLVVCECHVVRCSLSTMRNLALITLRQIVFDQQGLKLSLRSLRSSFTATVLGNSRG